MKLGAERKKVAILCGLLVIAAITLYVQVFSGPSEPAPAPRPVAANATPAAVTETRAAVSARRTRGTSLAEFKPVLRPPNPKDRPDPATIDPQIRFDLLARLEKVQVESSGRNIFQMGSAPAPAGPQKPPAPLPKSAPTIPINHPPATAPSSSTPTAPQAPRITFHYYGFQVSNANGRKQAFLLDGDEIMIAGENEMLKRGRYKVTHIGVNSITIEDTQFKSSQTLQLEEVKG